MSALLKHQIRMLSEAAPGSDAEKLRKQLTREDERIEWLQTVWHGFQRRARTDREMTSSEYHLASGWLARGLPLAVVLRALKDFDGKPRRLEALAKGVEEAARYHFDAVGALTELPKPGPLE